MIYIASEVRNNAPSSAAFVSKGLTDFTQGRIRDITLFGKPTNTQVAFSGYKDAIEAFLYAKATGMKVLTSGGYFPIPEDYTPTVPLPYPSTVFRLAKKPNADQLRKMKEGLERYGLEEVQIGKGDPSFVLRSPTFQHLSRTLPAIANSRTGNVEGSAQADASLAILRIYQCIDLFLSVNTYSYRKGDDERKWEQNKKTVNDLLELRVAGYWYRDGYDKDTKMSVTSAGEKRKIDDQEEADLTPHRNGIVPVTSSVLVAKPSPFESSTSWGDPSSVPNRGGLLFPYFSGMLAGDTPGLRELISEHFFRNLGSPKIDARAAFKELRTIIGSFGSTTAGILLTHVMKGVSLALQTQTQLYLLFDGNTYLGFCLLGEEFSIFAHGKWVDPLKPTELKKELRSLRTHDKSLEDLVEQLKKCMDLNGDIIDVTKDQIDSCSGLADALARMNTNGSQEGEVENVTEILGRLSLDTTYKTYSVSSLTWAIDQLTFQRDQPFPEETPFYIPLTGWTGIGKKEYKVLASFGTRGPSFRNSKGTEINIPRIGEQDKMDQKDEKGAYIRQEIIVGSKVLSEAVKDWASLRASRSMRMDFAERAKGSRNVVFRRNNGLNEIWGKLKEAASAGLLGDIEVDADSVRVEKRPFDSAFGSGSFDDVTF